MNKLEIQKNENDNGIVISFEEGKILFKRIGSKFSYEIVIKDKRKKFVHKKAIWEIGEHPQEPLYKNINEVFAEKPPLGDMNEFLYQLSENETKIKMMTSNEVKEIKSWLEVKGGGEKPLNDDQKEEFKKLLKEGNYLDYILDVAELKAVGQRNQLGLITLIAMSSVLEDPLHNISTGLSASGKTYLTDTIYELFPNEYKESFSRGTTAPTLANLTKYAEGEKILANKFIRLGDMGNEKEVKELSDFMLMIRELMSEGKTTVGKNVLEDDEYIVKNFLIDGCGSVHMSTTSRDIGGDTQMISRAILSSPDNSHFVDKIVAEYQLDDIKRNRMLSKFRQKRPIVAHLILKIFKRIELIRKQKQGFRIENPYSKETSKFLDIDQSKYKKRLRNYVRDLPKSITIFKILGRETFVHEKNHDMVVLMTPEDYVEALKIIAKPIRMMVDSDIVHGIQYINIIKEHFDLDSIKLKQHSDYEKGNYSEDGEGKIFFTTSEMQRWVGIENNWTVIRDLDILIRKKILFKVSGKPNKYFVTEEINSGLIKDVNDEIVKDILKDIEGKYEEAVEELKRDGYVSLKRGKNTP